MSKLPKLSKSIKLGRLFIFSAPSGAGKTSLLKALIDQTENLFFSVSYTTRSKRPGEVEGVDYHFVDVKTFKDMEQQGDFLESAKVFNNYYGTSLSWVNNALEEGKDVILEIDWQGAAQIAKKIPDCVKIFILPPSLKILKERLVNRAQDKEKVIYDRMAKAKSEISHYNEFDYLLVNDDFDIALKKLRAIIDAARQHVSVQSIKLKLLLEELLAN